MVSKIKRQALMGNYAKANGVDNNNPNSMQFAKRSGQIYIEDKVSDHSQPLQGNHVSSSNQPMVQSSMKAPPVKPVKQPKPKAKDPNKREMSLEEKHKLGIGLQSLPPEKMKPAVQIIKKRNEHLKQDEDEIELDIEAVDTETLWELDRLITNWKKMVSKIKRQALMGNYAKTNGGNHVSSSNQPMVQSSMKAPPVKPVKQLKPKAKNPNKREMNLEEKHKLGIGLQSLPPEKMKQAVQIIKKRNEHLKQYEDEIELDIEVIDTETL
ncbi:hypothetical protein I3843_06G153500 [Carya illinoinensis]|nr:hypothetical protein I3843_06G153500 [Carya illinoinensis]